MKYLFFISWFRAREKKLVDQIDLDRMIGAATVEDSFKVLNDTDYAPYLPGKTYLDIEKIIIEEREDLKKTLVKMGMEEDVVKFLFLKDELDIACREAKERIFQEKGFQEKGRESDFLKEIRERKPNCKEEVDDIILDLYFKEANSFLKKTKEKKGEKFFDNYYQKIKDGDDFKKRDEALAQMEEDAIEKSREEVEGIIPILGFFIKKRRIEYFIRNVFALKRMGFDSQKIHQFIKGKRAL
jgi:vacuolar-type H+-ATPase subunit C/Vma6